MDKRKNFLTKVVIGGSLAKMKREIGLAGIIMVLVLAGNSFSEEVVTNRQILEKLEKIETKLNSMEVNIAIEENEKTVEKILKEYTLKEPKLAAVMRNVAL